jgi:glycosyltransferase involved in cell wall biosynthesis
MQKHFLSIIIPAYNEEGYIEKTLLSITRSPHKNYEIIVVCDSCSDRTEQISKKYTDKVHSVNFKNVAKARNFGASYANGNILVFFDADTVCSENYLHSILKNVDSGFGYGAPKIISESGTRKGKYIMKKMNTFNKKNKTVGGNCFVQKEHFLKINGFDDKLIKGQDTDFGHRLRNNGVKYVFIEDAHVVTSERRFKDYWYANFLTSPFKDFVLHYIGRKKYQRIRFTSKF